MKKYFLLLILSLSLGISADNLPAQDDSWLSPPDPSWYLHYDKAVEAARKSNKLIYVFRTGSDWCGWCVKLDREVFSTPEFKDWAADNVIMVIADFPAVKKLSPELVAQNEKLKNTYGIEGFPTVLLLDSDGNVIAQTGYQHGGAANYIAHLKSLMK